MNLIALLALTFTLWTGADIGCGIDPNGCSGGDGLDAGSAMDPNGRGWGVDPMG